jgi:hypothetical protein
VGEGGREREGERERERERREESAKGLLALIVGGRSGRFICIYVRINLIVHTHTHTHTPPYFCCLDDGTTPMLMFYTKDDCIHLHQRSI